MFVKNHCNHLSRIVYQYILLFILCTSGISTNVIQPFCQLLICVTKISAKLASFTQSTAVARLHFLAVRNRKKHLFTHSDLLQYFPHPTELFFWSRFACAASCKSHIPGLICTSNRNLSISISSSITAIIQRWILGKANEAVASGPRFCGPPNCFSDQAWFLLPFSIRSGYFIQLHKYPTAMRGSDGGKGGGTWWEPILSFPSLMAFSYAREFYGK